MGKKKSKRFVFSLNFLVLFLVLYSLNFGVCLLIFFKLLKPNLGKDFKDVFPLTKIASISAQQKPILIDPDFSYREDNQNQALLPQRIIIPSLNLDLPVEAAKIVDGFWETASQSASFGLGSALPSQIGNTVIFAHATPNLFGNLNLLKKQDLIYLLTENDWYVYQVKETKTVLPTAIEVISQTKDKTLTLYTCSGFKDAYRLVIIAKPFNN